MAQPRQVANVLYFPLMPGRLGFAVMTDEATQELRVRRGYWLRRARLRAGFSQENVAKAVGLAPGSGSSVSFWERGLRDPKTSQMIAMARLCGLPDQFLMDPPLTDDERLDRAIADASTLEREDWEAGEGSDPKADDEPDAGRGRQIA